MSSPRDPEQPTASPSPLGPASLDRPTTWRTHPPAAEAEAKAEETGEQDTTDTEASDPKRRWPRPSRTATLWLLLPILAIVFGILVGVGFASSISMPEVDSLDEFVPRLVTQLRADDGEVFRSYSRENREMLDANQVPQLVVQAVTAIEDSNFYLHGGVDLKGVVRSVIANLRQSRHAYGASTITMQLARMLFLTRDKTWKRKIEEAFLAVELEKRYSKEQILAFYCNLINLGHGNYGIQAAAKAFFGKPADALNLVEAATLAGIPQRPTAYSVYRHPERVVARRNEVLRRMLDVGFIDQEVHDQAAAEPLVVVSRRQEAPLGAYFAEEVRRAIYADYGGESLYDRGLQVTTTLDRTIQAAAERAVRDGLTAIDHGKGWRGAIDTVPADEIETHDRPSWNDLEELKADTWYEGLVTAVDAKQATVRIDTHEHVLERAGMTWTRRRQPDSVLDVGDVAWFRLEPAEVEDGSEDEPAPPRLMLEQAPEMEAAAVVLESATGAIRAMVGGWDFERNEFNRVTQAQRQVGSAFKAMVFGAALENGYTPADVLFDGPAVFPGASPADSYSPRNYYRKYYGIITLRQALELSVNVTAVKLQDLVGPELVIDFAHRLGVKRELAPYPSLALGAIDMTPLELATAYATIANQGIHVEPYLVERITDRNGRVLEEHTPRARKAMDPAVAYILTHMLKGVVDNGTAKAVRNLDIDLAGKTGTTDRWTDAWFAGFTPSHTILTWVGYDKNRPLGRGHTGAHAALPIWRHLVEDGLANGWLTPGDTFPVPPGIIEAEIEYHTGLRPGNGAEQVITESFIEGTEPQEVYDLTWARTMTLPWYLQEPFYLPKEGERMPAQIDDWGPVLDVWEQKARSRQASAAGRP